MSLAALADVTVEIGFGVNAVGGDFFVLDDPDQGELDNTTYLLAPDTVFVVVHDPANGVNTVRSIETNRGRNREIDEYGTGTATVVFNDNDRTFDPAYNGSPYFGQIVPMKRIAIRCGNINLFAGWVDDWRVTYEPGDNLSRVTASCVDAFAILANQKLSEIAPAHSGDLSGERITRVLDRGEINFPASRAIDDGNSTLGATTFGENAAAYLQACSRAEAGYLFVTAGGTFTFHGRTAALNMPADVTFSDDPDAGIPYQSIAQRSSADLLYNLVTGVSETTGNPLVAFDQEAADGAFIRTLPLGTLFTIDDTQTQNLLDFHLERFKAPELRFQGVTVNVAAVDDVTSVLSLDLTDVVSVQRSPLSVGAMIDRLSLVDGVSHHMTSGSWTMDLTFANVDTRSFLVLDDPVFGVLGTNRLAF